MTEPSRKVLISCGVGSSLRIASRAASWLSSTMMSLHRSMHSSQMKTEGPAISLRTSCWLLLQKEQCNTLSSADPFFSGIKLFFQFSGQDNVEFACRVITGGRVRKSVVWGNSGSVRVDLGGG